jgi:hypothetical protein
LCLNKRQLSLDSSLLKPYNTPAVIKTAPSRGDLHP